MDKIEQVIVFSRHGLRYPSTVVPKLGLFRLPHISHNLGRLSLYGRKLEISKGHWLRDYLKERGFLISENEVEVFSTSSSRTVESAQCFIKGLLPGMDIPVSGKIDGISTDKIFGSALPFKNEEECRKLQAEINSGFDYWDRYAEDRRVLEEALNSASKSFVLSSEENKIILKNEKGPEVKGDLHTAALVADSLIHLHFLFPVFLRKLKASEWKSLSRICDKHREFIFGNSKICQKAAGPILEVLSGLLKSGQKGCSFFYCHDVNLFCLMNSLNMKTDNTISSDFGCFPSGCMLIFIVKKTIDDQKKITVNMCYPEDQQIIKHKRFSCKNKPRFIALLPEGIHANDEGEISIDDFISLLNS